MSDTKWRISGGIGEPEEPAQVMTQGLGFPLRPVADVPPQDSGEELEGVPIAEGAFMQWHGEWRPSVLYPKGSVVRDSGWLMIANANTLERAAPVSEGNPAWALPDTPVWTDNDNLSVIYSGHLYEFTQGGWLRALRVWAPTLSGTTNYRIIVIDVTDPNLPKYSTIEEPVLNLDDWTIISSFDRIVYVGTRLLIYLDALDSGGDTLITGGWTYNGQSNTNPPAIAGWNHPNDQSLIRIDKVDLDATDRTSELLGITPDTEITFAETADTNYSISYRTTSSGVDSNSFVQVDVLITNTGPAGAPRTGNVTTMTANVPIAQTTDYVELPGGAPTPTWGTVTGYLAFDGVDQGGDANGYGVDIYFDPATVPTSWDLMADPGG